MFGRKATLPVDWVFPTPSVDKITMYHWTGDMMEEQQHAYNERSTRQKSQAESSDVQVVDTEYPGWVFGLVF